HYITANHPCLTPPPNQQPPVPPVPAVPSQEDINGSEAPVPSQQETSTHDLEALAPPVPAVSPVPAVPSPKGTPTTSSEAPVPPVPSQQEIPNLAPTSNRETGTPNYLAQNEQRLSKLPFWNRSTLPHEP